VPIDSFNPATGELIATAAGVDEEGARAAVAAARDAFPAWSITPFSERQRLLGRWLDLLVAEDDTFARLVALEAGKPITEARLVDVFTGCETLEYFHLRLHRLLRPERVRPYQPLFAHWRTGYRFDPLGVIAVITPWNYPLNIPIIEVASAVAAGNTVVFKPASPTVLTGLALGELVRRAGFPPGVVNVVALPGRLTDALVDDSRVAKVLFTGSVEVGRHVAVRAAARLAPVQLELGGKDAAVVAADADLERTAHGLVWGAFMNTGQTCSSIERVYVERPAFEPLLERVVAMTRALKVGDPMAPDTDVGPMTTAEQREVVHAHVDGALAAGARALTGGMQPAGAGLFYPPTVLVDVTEDMVVMRDETFGPVMPVVPVGSVDEGIARANASRFGLTASGWTRSRATARRFSHELVAGVVTINEHTAAFVEPTGAWGGLGESGIGRSHGRLGLLEVSNVKYVASDFGRGRAAPWHYPYDEDLGRFADAAMPTLYSRGGAKLRGMLRLVGTRRFLTRVRKSSVVRRLGRFLRFF
jgi:succinate-semialdehyde dehydrogenase/glutarate-semialdehyde dehydrogenase